MAVLFIDKEKLKNNIEITKKLAGSTKIIGVVKENGYGLGLIPFSSMLVENGIEILAVSDIEEAVMLRASNIDCDILLLAPLYKKEDIYIALKHHLILCIASRECGRLAEEAAEELSLFAEAHLCIDTGFGRYGFSTSDVKGIIDTINYMQRIDITGIYSHFYAPACKRKNPTAEQFEQFMSLCRALMQNLVFIGNRHIAATCGLLKYPEMKLDAVRIGSAFLGRLPFEDEWGYQPIGQLKTVVSEIHTLPAGKGIGYGHSYIAKKKTTVAIIPAGYSHGLGIGRHYNPRTSHVPSAIWHFSKQLLSSNRLSGYYKEIKCPVLGKIGMNSLAIDITGTDIDIGDTISFPVNPIYVDSNIERLYI